jgi:hypothetical protein
MSDQSGFVVRVTTRHGLPMWLSAPRAGMVTVFGPREKAAVFLTEAEAQSAIFKVPAAFKVTGTTFTVEPIL